MKKDDHWANITNDRGVLDGSSTAGRSFGKAGSADDIFNLRPTGTSDAITLSTLGGLSGFSDSIGRMYAERGGVLPHKRGRRVRYSRLMQAEQLSKEDVPSVPALFVVPVPSPMGELDPVITAYRHELGAAGGQCLIWMGLGNPGHQDGLFKKQMELPMRLGQDKRIGDFLRAVAADISEPDFVKGEYYKLAQNLGIPTGDLPAILFVAPDPVNTLAVLHLDVGMFKDPDHVQSSMLMLLKAISQDKILKRVPGGQFNKRTILNVQEYLGDVALELRNTTIDDTPRVALPVNNQHGSAIVTACGSDRGSTALTYVQYRQLLLQANRYDVIIDGIAGKCIKPHERNVKFREERLEPAEFKILRDYIVQRQPKMPTRVGGKHANYAAALRTLQKARQKLESSNGESSTPWFQPLRGGWQGPSLFLFSPPRGRRWLLIDLLPEAE